MTAFYRSQCDLTVIGFLLKTSPAHIRSQFFVILDQLIDINWEMRSLRKEVERLRFILSNRTYNPLRFLSQARTHRIRKATMDALHAKNTALKMIRKTIKFDYLSKGQYAAESINLYDCKANLEPIQEYQQTIETSGFSYQELWDQYPSMWAVNSTLQRLSAGPEIYGPASEPAANNPSGPAQIQFPDLNICFFRGQVDRTRLFHGPRISRDGSDSKQAPR
ncbi:hypothetical protein BDV96DRAFT_642835 [Lophiotrema nucula]|uniref:Uncharacterized protein n=1 Tax=Lophiotrema nucula TaxID=690887 RepID=A0A6A5ZK73_9PLEO|nr:hypothetical protein BDV96DRAFT_642835 [Lophiotrema nucula]